MTNNNDEIKLITDSESEKTTTDTEEETNFITIPPSNHQSKIIIASITIPLIFISIILLIFKDIIFPSMKDKTPTPQFPELAFHLSNKYTVINDDFDSEQINTHWLAKNFLRMQIIENLAEISRNWVGYTLAFIGEDEKDNTSHNSNMQLTKIEVSFEFLLIKELIFNYQIISDKLNIKTVEKVKNYNYKGELKLFISTNQLIKKLPKFDESLALQENIIINDDAFDSEVKETHFYALNYLFDNLNIHYKERNKFDPLNLQTYYQVELWGAKETDNNSNNTNIIIVIESSTFSALKVSKFTFQINVKVRDQLVKKQFPITYQQSLNLIISNNKLQQKLNERNLS